VLSLVTGSSGLLGSCLTSILVGRGEALRLVDLVPPHGRGELAPNVEFRQGDLRERAFTEAACEGVDVVYHLAALQRMKPHVLELLEGEIFDANVRSTANVLDAAERAGVRKVVYVSSSGVYGLPERQPIDETHPIRPIGAYGRSKVKSEELCREKLARGLDVTMLRPVSLFGPHMAGVFLMLFDWVRRGRPVYIAGKGQNRVDMASAWDVAEACQLAAVRPGSRGQAFNLGSAGVPTVHEQVEALITHAGSRSRIVPVPAGLIRNGARALHLVGLSPLVPEHYLLADREFVLDQSRAHRLLGWGPRHTNVQMTNAAYDWYVETWPAGRPFAHPMLRLVDRLSAPLGARGS
jgi:nucleoside-diphosphate-sugar epimerase